MKNKIDKEMDVRRMGSGIGIGTTACPISLYLLLFLNNYLPFKYTISYLLNVNIFLGLLIIFISGYKIKKVKFK